MASTTAASELPAAPGTGASGGGGGSSGSSSTHGFGSGSGGGGGGGPLQATIEVDEEGEGEGEEEGLTAESMPPPPLPPLSPPLPPMSPPPPAVGPGGAASLSTTWSGGSAAAGATGRGGYALRRGYSLSGEEGGFRAVAAGGEGDGRPGSATEKERGSFRFDSAQVMDCCGLCMKGMVSFWVVRFGWDGMGWVRVPSRRLSKG